MRAKLRMAGQQMFFVFGLTLVFLIQSPDSHPIRETGKETVSHVAPKDKGSEPTLFHFPEIRDVLRGRPIRGAVKPCGCTHVLLESDNEPSIPELDIDFL